MGESNTIETPRLTLRPFRPLDAPPLYEIQRDEGAMRFTYRARSLEECAKRLQTSSFNPAYWGRGLATEPVRTSLHYGFETASLSRIDAFAVPANVGSIRVLETCGFVFSSYEPRLERNRYTIERA